MKEQEKQKILQAGKIAGQVREFAKQIIKPGMFLLEIAEKIEDKIIEVGKKIRVDAKPAFPTNLSINDISAHYTPSHDDETKAHGLLKIDFGVHIDGWIADTAFSLDLEDNEENKKLIKASQQALDNAIDTVKKLKQNIPANEIGKAIQQAIESHGFSPITNLSGHEIAQYELHAGITIPNIDDKKNITLQFGLYAIEPFATTGNGKVYDGKPSGIYSFIQRKPVRGQIAREILNYIENEYQTLPFCSRWLVKKFGARALLGIRELEKAEVLHHFNQLVEISHKPVSQAEHTILITEKEIVVTTE